MAYTKICMTEDIFKTRTSDPDLPTLPEDHITRDQTIRWSWTYLHLSRMLISFPICTPHATDVNTLFQCYRTIGMDRSVTDLELFLEWEHLFRALGQILPPPLFTEIKIGGSDLICSLAKTKIWSEHKAWSGSSVKQPHSYHLTHSFCNLHHSLLNGNNGRFRLLLWRTNGRINFKVLGIFLNDFFRIILSISCNSYPLISKQKLSFMTAPTTEDL